ncbi:MAG: tungsten cofactor oxidoreductase radical SAM maturase [Anaerolineales bacterium]
MPKVTSRNGQGLILPQDFLKRRHLSENLEYWLDAREGELILLPRIPDVNKLYIEATTGCNLQCRTCIRNIWDDPQALMSKETIQCLLASLDDLPNLQRVIFSGFGESLTHPHIFDFIESIRKHELAVTIATNGLLINPIIASELVKLGVDRVMISIDGGKPETFADVRGALLSQIVENIHNLNEAKRQLRSLFPSIGIEFVALRSNVAELEQVSQLASQLNVSRILVSHVLPYTEELRDEVLYGYEPVPPFKTISWPLRADAWIMWATQDLPRMHWGADRRCRFVQDHAMVIGWDGGISPCYALSHNYRYFAIDGREKLVSRYGFGNVNENSLAEIWMSEDYVRFRNEVKGYHFPSCPNCDLRETCDLRRQNKGCWGWNPSCADCLWAQDIVRCP